MKDNYPTRLKNTIAFIKRTDKVCFDESYSEYEKNGFIVIKDFFAREDVDLLLKSEASGLVTNEPGIQGIRSRTGVHENEPFKSFLENNTKLIEMVKDILGSKIYIHQSRINYKSNIGANGWHWHSDFETWHAQDGMPNMRCLTAMIPLTENTNCNGSLMVIPTSHEVFYSCKKAKSASSMENFADQKEGLPDNDAIKYFFERANGIIEMVICEPGDLVLFDCNIIHGSTQNMTPIPRTNLFFVFNSIENQLVQPFSTDQIRPDSMAHRNVSKFY